MPKTIKLEPNYNHLFEQFLRDAMLHMNVLSRPGRTDLHRSDVYNMVASLRIALGCITKVSDLETLRSKFDEAAEKMYAQVQRDQEDAEEAL